MNWATNCVSGALYSCSAFRSVRCALRENGDAISECRLLLIVGDVDDRLRPTHDQAPEIRSELFPQLLASRLLIGSSSR